MKANVKKDWVTVAGYRALVVLACDGSHHCGYVGIPKSHPLCGVGYCHAPNFRVHGGLTFADNRDDDKKLWWFGFDCAHAGDIMRMEGFKDIAMPGVTFKDVDYVVAECEQLAQQLKTVQSEKLVPGRHNLGKRRAR